MAELKEDQFLSFPSSLILALGSNNTSQWCLYDNAENALVHLWNESCHQGRDGILNFDIFPLISIAFSRLTKAINRTGDYHQTSLSGVVFKLASEHLLRLGKTQFIDPSFKKLKFFFYFLKYWNTVDVQASQVALVVKNLPANAGDIRDVGSIPGLGRSPGGGHVNPLQYSCLENPMDRGAWQAAVPRVTKSRRWLKQLSMCMHSWFTVLCLFLLYSKVTQLSICIDIFFHILFHYRSSQHIEYSSLCCTGGSCLFILHIIICIF